MSNEFFQAALAGYPEAQRERAREMFQAEIGRKMDFLRENAVTLGLDPEAEIHDESLILTEAGAFTAPLWVGFWRDRVLIRLEGDARNGR